VDVDELEISALVVKGYLPEEARNDVKAIKGAIEGGHLGYGLRSTARDVNEERISSLRGAR
jgi:hypothetical protein